jgi:hypothetical protein
MSLLKKALALAEQGFHVFPLQPNSKLPAIFDFPEVATRNPDKIRSFWVDPVMEIEQPYNIGISTSCFGDDKHLIVVDVDNKAKKKGSQSIVELELKGILFPKTRTQKTPTGGYHYIYWTDKPAKNSVSFIGDGLDIRAQGGYIVGAGSIIEGKEYTSDEEQFQEAEEWLKTHCAEGVKHEKKEAPKTINRDRAIASVTHYFLHEAPPAIEGEGGNNTTFLVMANAKDRGVSQIDCMELALEHYNPRCLPPWSMSELGTIITSAYRSSKSAVGSNTAEADFKDIETEIEEEEKDEIDILNETFAFVTAGGGHHILREGLDSSGHFKLEHMNEQSFHKMKASFMMIHNDKPKAATQVWMASARRRSYDGICFKPGQETPTGFYNLWRGFAYDPLPKDEKPTKVMQDALKAFSDHALENVCKGDVSSFEWLMNYFAHLIQKPWELPLVALVFWGEKGVGKNALVERIGALLGSHFFLTSDKRYLVGNFNGHFENNLMCVLDEAFWSGDKQSEGVLKGLITGTRHAIEHKGKESYTVENCTRTVIIGNEKWLIPASNDERRFAVFEVGNGKKQNLDFFQKMRENMEAGGYQYLLRYLLDRDISNFKVSRAPNTEGLYEQKMNSLTPIQQWWVHCLQEQNIYKLGHQEGWPVEIPRSTIQSSIRQYYKDRAIHSRVPTDSAIGKELRELIPGLKDVTHRKDKVNFIRHYKLPLLVEARMDWDTYIGYRSDWA